jgi:predicted permease
VTDPRAPRLLDAVLRRLFAGPLGDEARLEMDRLYRILCARRGRFVGTLWYLGHLVHPHTWALAVALRRRQHRQANASARSIFGGSSVSWLDVKLGIRMVARYPVITAVSGLAISVTIAVAIATFAWFQDFALQPEIPLPEPERVVSLGLKDRERMRNERRLLHELDVWREALASVEHVGLWRRQDRTLVGSEGTGEVVRTAVMSASGFDVARVAPLIGRPLRPSDEIAGAPRVVVIGYEPWTTRFEADPNIVGRQMLLDGEPYTVVGVMPEGFGFPYAERFWLPMLDDADAWPVMDGPGGYFAFGRLAPGATLARADAELKAVMRGRAADLPETHRWLAARVMPYTDTHTGMDDHPWLIWLHRLILGLITLLVLIPFSNVAVLVYARTATRTGEIAVRSGLGASRGRIVFQLFVEALVVALPSALLGIAVGLLALEHIDRLVALYFGSGMPFWARSGWDPWAMAYAGGLAVFAAGLAAVIPGMQATGRRAHEHLKAAGGRHDMRLGRVWTGLVVAQVAITVAGLPLAGWIAWHATGFRMASPTFTADGYLGVWLAARPPGAPGPDASTPGPERIAEVVRRTEALPGVMGVYLSDRSPTDITSVGFSSFSRIEIDGDADGVRSHAVVDMAVDAGFFEFLGVGVRSGREFLSGDARAAIPPVVVSRAFVERTLRGANPVGRFVRTSRPPGEGPAPWREIVGVVDDLLEDPLQPDQAEGMMFVPIDRSRTTTAHLTVHAPGLPPSLATDIRRIVADVDPSIRLDWIAPLTKPRDPIRTLMAGVAAVIIVVLSSILFLATAGVFSLISFNVTRRRREIGIRTALGARPRQVLLGVMAQCIRQLAYGVAAGALVAALVPPLSVDGVPIRRDPRLLVFVAGVLVAMGVAAAWGPARAGLRVQPMDALRQD